MASVAQTSELSQGEPGSGSSESDVSYYGWRVVFAAGCGVMAGFGSLFVYTFAIFVKPLGGAVRLEP